MAGLIPSYPISEFKKLKASELKRLKSAEITSDGEYLCTIVRANTDYIRTQVEGLAHLSNTQGGEDIEKLLGDKS